MARVLRAEFRTNPAPTNPAALQRRATQVGCCQAKRGEVRPLVSSVFCVLFGGEPNAREVGKSMDKLLIIANHCS